MDLEGRVAIVTGAGRGLGRAIALELARSGAFVAAAARSPDQVAATAEEIRSRGGRALALTCDVGDREQVEALVARTREGLGPPLILVNNAGAAASAPIGETTDAMWDQMMRVNAAGPFYASRAVVPAMVEAGWGRIVNVASTAARHGTPYVAAYTASKHAVLGLTRALAAELAPRGVTVNAVCPGWLHTTMTEASVQNIVERTGRDPGEARRILENFSPQKRLMDPQEVARLVAYLCSSHARGINGQGIVLDGGALQA